MNSIGERLKYLRKLNKLTQKQIAIKTGVQRGNISHYEKNYFLPSKVALISLANFIKTSYGWMFNGDTPNINLNSELVKSHSVNAQNNIARNLVKFLT